MRLKKDFDLAVYLHSNTADAWGIQEQYHPDLAVNRNLRMIHEMVVVPLLNNLQPGYWLNLTCAYRCSKVNTKNKGAKRSQHLCNGTDSAVDLELYNDSDYECNDVLIKLIDDMGLKYTQLIQEKGKKGWVHIGYDPYDLKMEKFVV